MAIQPGQEHYNDILVAVHGIGQQIRYSTVRYVATQLAGSSLGKGIRFPPVAPQPLGYFHSEVKGVTSVVGVDDPIERGSKLSRVGFAEVFWADIPDQVLKEGSTIEETKAWGRTVVARAQAIWNRSKKSGDIQPDFSLAGEVLDEIIETVYVLENLLFLVEKAGLFKFDLKKVLEAYLGDVQIVAEFASFRKEIVLRFHQAMQHIYEVERDKGNGRVRLHVVAHSEGTVVSFLGLLQALSGMRLVSSGGTAPELDLRKTGAVPEWIEHVHGYMTIGSPIDKHLLLWPRMWSGLEPSLANGSFQKHRIKWRNYYDYGDPIGFELDTAREQLAKWGATAFEFRKTDDYGFARYVLPGKAHNDYWEDPEVFEHFVSEAGIGETAAVAPGSVQPPATKWPIYALSPALPYLLSFVLLFAGVFLLEKAVLAFTYPWGDPLMRHLLISEIGVDPTAVLKPMDVFRNTFGIAALIAGTTLLARFPRLAGGKRWLIAGLLGFAAGALLYALSVTCESQREIGAIFAKWDGPTPANCNPLDKSPSFTRLSDNRTIGVWLVALVVGVFGLCVALRNRNPKDDRRQRWLLRGMRPFILTGALAVGLFVASQMFPQATRLQFEQERRLLPEQARIVKEAGFDAHEIRQLFAAGKLANLPRVEGVLTARPPAWPVLLAGGIFLYLWWLATLIFDMSFVWQRYIRNAVANQRLKAWTADRAGDDESAEPRPAA